MALPCDFSNALAYFTEAVKFLQTHDWIYKHANTTFIRAGLLERFPSEFKEYFLSISTEDLNHFPFVHSKEVKIKYEHLRNFRTKLKQLIPAEAFSEATAEEQHCQNEPSTFRKMNLKKQHEISKLAHQINALCGGEQQVLLDFGAGLGYLSEQLYKLNPNTLILGLEADAYRVEAAQKRQQQNMPAAENAIMYKQQFISEDSQDFIEASMQQLVQTNQKGNLSSAHNATIVGLHACADLTITAMKLFLRMPAVRRLIIMPCCYHKLQQSSMNDDRCQNFVNFPLSAALKQAIATNSHDAIAASDYFNRPFLRLACQQTSARWSSCSAQQHNTHGFEMFWRALADAVADPATETVVKIKEQSKQQQKVCTEQAQTFAALRQQFALRSKATNELVPWSERHEVRFNELIQRYSGVGYKLAEALTCLQTTMQKFCENVVLYDRLCYMQEYTVAQDYQVNARFRKILNEKLSPRCYVLIAEKL